MNEQILGEMEKALQLTNLKPAPSMQEILRNADAGDLTQQKETYHELLDLEVERCSAALRHRAHMMRLRADEFDKMADSLVSQRNELIRRNDMIVGSTDNICDILQEHAHIEPTKV